ncbi:MAG TPA: hypothetical protein VNL35_07245 [Chloroflexota bacterium]|nr:hypothetical protein [Chloroflexota bacterium]
MKLVKRPQATYLLGAVIVWVGLIAATAITLGGTSHFGEMAPILFVGAAYFIVIAPLGIWHTTVLPNQPRNTGATRWRGSMEQLVGRVRERPYLLGLLGLIGLLGIPFQQPILFLFYLLFGLFAFAVRRPGNVHPRPR